MVYITVHQSPMYHQMTFEEFISQNFSDYAPYNTSVGNTKTYAVEEVSERFTNGLNIGHLVRKLKEFNTGTEKLRESKRSDLYHTFHIPKKSGGLRKIDEPLPELMNALRQLKLIFEEDFHALYHTSAFAYIKGRCTLDAVKRHQQNESRWFGKFDLHDFFGSTTLEFMMQQFSMVFPFSEVVRIEEGRAELEKALELATLNGGLPQGTPVSPTITNIMMIPIDFNLNKRLRDMEFERAGVMTGADGEGAPLKQRMIYTRYADDFIISSRYAFDIRQVQDLLLRMLEEYHAPFSLNVKKTRYGSSAGRNWNLGVMLNKDNNITIGYRRKQQFQNMIHNYIFDRKNGTPWEVGDIRTLDGYYNYYRMVEKDVIDKIVEHASKKYGVDIIACIREDLR